VAVQKKMHKVCGAIMSEDCRCWSCAAMFEHLLGHDQSRTNQRCYWTMV